MRLLLDTHALLWLLTGNDRLPGKVRRLIEDEAELTYASAACAWEITTKFRLGKLPGARALAVDFAAMTREAALEHLSISVAHGEMAGRFDDLHMDPFDRMLIAQALVDGLVLISNETIFDRFGVERIW